LAWLWLVAWLLLGCFGLALDRLGCSEVAWLLAFGFGFAAAKWLGYWLFASGIGLAEAKWLGYG
jgi:hypothetical protein